MEISKIMYAKINLFEKYGIDKYLGCMCLSVAPTYRGLNIGQRLLEAQYAICKLKIISVNQKVQNI